MKSFLLPSSQSPKCYVATLRSLTHALTENLEHIKTQFDLLYDMPFPTAGGKEVQGIDLVLLDSDIMGIVDSFLANKSSLPMDKVKILRGCLTELDTITPYLNENEKCYFNSLKLLAQETLTVLQTNG